MNKHVVFPCHSGRGAGGPHEQDLFPRNNRIRQQGIMGVPMSYDGNNPFLDKIEVRSFDSFCRSFVVPHQQSQGMPVDSPLTINLLHREESPIPHVGSHTSPRTGEIHGKTNQDWRFFTPGKKNLQGENKEENPKKNFFSKFGGRLQLLVKVYSLKQGISFHPFDVRDPGFWISRHLSTRPMLTAENVPSPHTQTHYHRSRAA